MPIMSKSYSYVSKESKLLDTTAKEDSNGLRKQIHRGFWEFYTRVAIYPWSAPSILNHWIQAIDKNLKIKKRKIVDKFSWMWIQLLTNAKLWNPKSCWNVYLWKSANLKWTLAVMWLFQDPRLCKCRDLLCIERQSNLMGVDVTWNWISDTMPLL